MKGKLKYEDFGMIIPVTDAAASKPPIYYRNAEVISITYKTNYETAAKMLPEELEFAGDYPTATILISNYPFSTLGPYKEAILVLNVKYKGKEYGYMPNLFVTNEPPMLAGREIWGYAKKLAEIEFIKEHDQICAIIERPKGNRILTAEISPRENVKAEQWKNVDAISLKKIPSATGEYDDVCQLIGCEYTLNPIVATDGITELWKGESSIKFENNNLLDPWYNVPVLEIEEAYYGHFNNYLPYGYILYDYLKNKSIYLEKRY